MELPTELRVRASWDEFLAILPDCEYRVEYDQHEIISFMGYASVQHEILVATLLQLLGRLIDDKDYIFTGSNLALHIPGMGNRYFNADCCVLKNPVERIQLSKNMRAVTNPILLVEVLSASTYGYDLATKASAYRDIPSLQQLLFIDSESTHIISQIRQADTHQWLLSEHKQLADTVPLFNGASFGLEAVYGGFKM